MASFCTNCGTQLGKKDKVCSKCGTPVSGKKSKTKTKATEVPKADEPVKEKKGGGIKKLFKRFITLLILIVVAVIGVKIAIYMTNYESAVRRMVKALKDYDMATLEELSSTMSNELYAAQYGDDFYEEYENMVSDVLDIYEDSNGIIKKISYEITEITELSNRRIDEIEENLYELYGVEVTGIKKVMELEMTITVKGAKNTETYTVDNLYLIKERGGWKLYYGVLNY